MPKQSQYLPRKAEIIKVCRQAREDCGIHWLLAAQPRLDIPTRTLQRLCHEWRVFYTSRQYYRKNKQRILSTLQECHTLEEASKKLSIPRSTLFRLRKKWEGVRTLKQRRPRRFVGSTGIVTFVSRR